MRDDRSALLGTLAILVAACAFGTLGVVTRFAYEAGMTPGTLPAWRAAMGTLGLVVLIAGDGVVRHRPIVPRGIARREVAMLALGAALAVLINVGLFGAFGRMTVALVLLAFYTYPVMIGVAGALFLGEPLDRTRVAALGLAVAGTSLVVVGGVDPASGFRVDPVGLALAVGAATAQAGLSLVTRSGFRSIPSAQATVGILGGMAVVFVLGAVLSGELDVLALPLREPPLLLIAVYLGLVTAAVSTFLFVIGIRLVGPLVAGILSLFDPIVAIVLAALILDETLTPVGLAGGALVIAAAVLVQRAPRREPAGRAPTEPALDGEPLPPVG